MLLYIILKVNSSIYPDPYENPMTMVMVATRLKILMNFVASVMCYQYAKLI